MDEIVDGRKRIGGMLRRFDERDLELEERLEKLEARCLAAEAAIKVLQGMQKHDDWGAQPSRQRGVQ